MLGLAYLLAMVAVGDHLSRRFLPQHSIVHRVSSAFVVGLVLSTWITYLVAVLFAGLDQPLWPANAAFLGLTVVVLRNVPRRVLRTSWPAAWLRLRSAVRRESGDLLVLAALVALAAWLAFSTFGVRDGALLIGNLVHSDFGSTTAIAQSFAAGHNFPTELPHFAGESIKYHFLFYFQAGNLTFLGLDPALSLNLLSIFSMGALLGLIMTLGRLLFRAPIFGRLGAGLFFLHGSLAWIPFVAARPTVESALTEILNRRSFLPSGFPFRGEEWGVWTMAIYANQRHFASGVALLLLVVIFLVNRYRMAGRSADAAADAGAGRRGLVEAARRRLRSARSNAVGSLPRLSDLRSPDAASFAFAGLLLGALPIWNGAVFVAAFVTLAALFLIFPIDRRYLFILAAATAAVSLPQLAFLRPSTGANEGFPAFVWGYMVENPTVTNVLNYMAFTFGPKLVLAGAAFMVLRDLPQKVFVAAWGLVLLTFTLQFSVEMLVNHKFLNIWLAIINLFAAYGLVRLWRAPPVAGLMVGRLAAAAFAVIIAVGGIIDLMPFKNGNMVAVPYDGDPLITWVKTYSDPRDVFLTDIVVTHPILSAGRSVYLGWPYYAWSAGYDMPPREAAYRRMYTETDPQALLALLREHSIAFVVFDDQLFSRGFVEEPDETVYQANFPLVFESDRYRNIRIYAVP